LSLKYIVNFEMHFVGYLYITNLIDARKMDYFKMREIFYLLSWRLAVS